MKCGYCGNELREDARFCPHCGAPLVEAPQASKEDIAAQQTADKGPDEEA